MEYEINGLLDRIKSEYHIGSDYKLAQFLGVVNGSIRHYRHGRSLPDLRVTERIAFQLGIDPDVLWASFQAQRATDEHAAETWTRIARRLREAGHAAVMTLAGLAVVLGFISTPPNAEAAVTDRQSIGQSVYYVKYQIKTQRALCALCVCGVGKTEAVAPFFPTFTWLRSDGVQRPRPEALRRARRCCRAQGLPGDLP